MQWFLSLITIVLFLTACESKPTAGTEFYVSSVEWPKKNYLNSNSKLNLSKIEIGRALFYDPILSKDSTISCASCHQQKYAFATLNQKLSIGIGDSLGKRNTPSLVNLAWHSTFMWDGAIHHLDMQSLAPISSPTEMGNDIGNVVNQLNKSPLYKKKFLDAYEDTLITGAKVLKCLAHFMLTFESKNSKYDQYLNKEIALTTHEQNGLNLFNENCSECHEPPLFTNNVFSTNYISINSSNIDFGRFSLTQDSSDLFLFKTPTLRNLEFSAPYMHDGRFDSLEEVLDHYIEAPNLAIDINEKEKKDLIAFLMTLSDFEFITNQDFSYPSNFFDQNEGK